MTVMASRFVSLPLDAVKELKEVFCTILEALIKLDLRGVS